MSEYKPDYLASPGEVVEDYYEDSLMWEWDIDQAISDTGCELSTDDLNAIMRNAFPISKEVASQLEKLFSRPAHFWINLERDYQADRARLSGISPWRKVVDEEPPRDGSEFLFKDSTCTLIVVWTSRNFYEDHEGPLNIDNGYWMPIPGGEE